MNGDWFNEIHAPTGEVRGHYESVYSHWKSVRAARKKELHGHSKKLFDGDYALDPLPRIITRNEFHDLQRGVDQRARAIRAFLFDYYGGGKRWKKIIPPFTLKSTIERHHRESVLGKLNPETIAFPYGPDIIRNQSGKWRVIEDSAGFIGGIGDLLASRRIMHRLVPNFRGALKASNDPSDFFELLAAHFKDQARKRNGLPLLHLRPFKQESDHETQRLARIFESLGVEVSTTTNQRKRLLVEDDGLFLHRNGRRERVGYLVLYSGPEQLDNRYLLSGLRIVASDRRGSYKTRAYQRVIQILGGKSIQTALLKNQAGTNFSPGVQFLNDKVFGLYVDQLIGFYLKEEPVLESIPAQSFAYRNHQGKWRLDRAALRRVLRSKDQFVVKRVDEDGGTGVWIGRKHARGRFGRLLEGIGKEPEKYIFQEFEHLSVLENRIVDFRIHAHVDPEKIIVSNNPWGRANWIRGNGKVNIGSNGFASPVVVVH